MDGWMGEWVDGWVLLKLKINRIHKTGGEELKQEGSEHRSTVENLPSSNIF